MPDLGALILPITIVVAAIGLLLVLTPRMLRAGNRKREALRSIELPCTVCQKPLIVAPNQLQKIAGSEIALVVRECPGAGGKPLAGYTCPYCEAFHVFALEGSQPRWLIANPFEPQATTNNCTECRQPLKRAPWPAGKYDGRLEEAEGLLPKHGLICSRCGSICCVECCQFVTRGKTQDGSLLCPRCFRGPVDKVHHF